MSFLWGAATSSHQIEGHNEHNDWWAWEAQGNIEGGARSGAATDHRHRFREDLRLAADLGLNSYRFSIEWSRIEPREGQWDAAALDWYRELIAECEKLGLLPMATLHHFTSPRWFAERGGFTAPDAPETFNRFVAQVARALGARIPLWCTINEPMVLAVGTYLAKIMPPAEYSPAKVSLAARGLFRAHALAYDTLHAEIRERAGPWAAMPLAVGFAHNLLDFMPDRPWHPLELLGTRLVRGFYNRAWLDAVSGRKVSFGVPGLIPAAPLVPEALGRRTADFIGVNYYTKAYVQWRRNRPTLGVDSGVPLQIAFARPHERISDVGWPIHPQGFARVLELVGRYGFPIYVTENGIADRDDRGREEYLRAHLRVIADAIARGRDIRGYFHWSLLDNFEWIKGFGPRFGLYAVDYESFARSARPSAHYYQKIIEAHRRESGFLSPQTGLFSQ